MNEPTQLNDRVIIHIMMGHGYTREQAQAAWNRFKGHLSARRFLGPLEKDIHPN